MTNEIDPNLGDGTSTLGVKDFFTKTNRYEARKWEDEFTLSHMDPKTGIVRQDLSEQRACPICDGSQFEALFNKQGFIHNRCSSCHSIYVSPSLTKKSFHELWYGDKSPYPFLDTVNSDVQKKFDRVRFLSPLEFVNANAGVGTVLDIGTGGGYFLQICEEFGWSAKGIDVYRRAADYASHNGLNVIHADVTEYKGFDNESFDFITLWEVIDLVPEPMAILDKALSLLKDGGYLGISFRNAYSLAAMVLREKCNVFIGSAHFQMMRFEAVVNLLESKGCSLEWHTGYISESKIIKNYLSYSDPYKGKPVDIEELELFDDDFIHRNKLSYKFNMVFKKGKKSNE